MRLRHMHRKPAFILGWLFLFAVVLTVVTTSPFDAGQFKEGFRKLQEDLKILIRSRGPDTLEMFDLKPCQVSCLFK